MIIVTYHAVGDRNSQVCVTRDQFRTDMDRLQQAGFSFVSLDACAKWLNGGSCLPPLSVTVTFDDAYASVSAAAVPLLAARSIPFTVFVIGARLGGDNRWPGQWPSVPAMVLMDRAQLVEAVEAGGSVGVHSWSHPSLPDVDDDTLEREVVAAGERLSDLVGSAVHHYAYPYGKRGAREIQAVSRCYRTGVNATPGVVERASCVHDLPRIDCHDLRVAIRLGILASRTLAPYLAVRRHVRAIRRGAGE